MERSHLLSPKVFLSLLATQRLTGNGALLCNKIQFLVIKKKHLYPSQLLKSVNSPLQSLKHVHLSHFCIQMTSKLKQSVMTNMFLNISGLIAKGNHKEIIL